MPDIDKNIFTNKRCKSMTLEKESYGYLINSKKNIYK
jgi:hypothetical protein